MRMCRVKIKKYEKNCLPEMTIQVLKNDCFFLPRVTRDASVIPNISRTVKSFKKLCLLTEL